MMSLMITLINLMRAEFRDASDKYQSGLLKNYLHSFLLLSERVRDDIDPVMINKVPALDYLFRFEQLLDIQFRTVKKVHQYAAQLNISSKKLIHVSERITGQTPKQLIDHRIMLESKRLLTNTDMTVKEIGYDLGFDESTNFVKYFKKREGVTPVVFRKRYAD